VPQPGWNATTVREQEYFPTTNVCADLRTGGSSARWQWYGKMAHNSYAVLNPTNIVMSAQYRIYFGDATTGDPAAYSGYDDATVTWKWLVELAAPPAYEFGAVETTNGAPLLFINSGQCVTSSLAVVNFRYTNAGPCALQYECSWPLVAVAATSANGGPATNHAAAGSCLQLEFASLSGPPGGSLGVWEPVKACRA